VHTPKQVYLPQNESIIQASAGARHSIVLTSDKKVYGWGDGEQGQLGQIPRWGSNYQMFYGNGQKAKVIGVVI
jgi:alpha-tubulin suppressor-like RCC1 family protein